MKDHDLNNKDSLMVQLPVVISTQSMLLLPLKSQ